MSRNIMTCLLLFIGSFIIAQDADERLIRRMADQFLESIDFVVVDQNGKAYPTYKDAPGEELRIKSPYLDWLYWNGLFNIGMYNLGAVLEEPRYIDYPHKAYDFIFEQEEYFQPKNKEIVKKNWWEINPAPSLIQKQAMLDLDNYGTMTAALIDVYTDERDGKHQASPYLELYKDQIEKSIAQLKKQKYLEDGTLARHWFFDPSVWIDDMYMMISFLSRYAAMNEDAELFDFAAHQVILFHELLINPNTGLYYHGYYGDVDMLAKAHWGRANGWMFMGIAELLTRLPKDHKDRAKIEKIYKDFVVNIATYQSKEGTWHQILDRDDSYLETSCTAMFVFGIARGVNLGILAPRYSSIAGDGWVGLRSKVDANLDIHDICIGTGMSPATGDYYDRPALKNDIHGTGAFFKAAAEYLKMKKLLN